MSLSQPSTYRKAIVAALIAALTALGAAIAPNPAAGLGDVTLGQWIAVAVALLGTFSATYWTPNAEAK